jgi:hypothetical protein
MTEPARRRRSMIDALTKGNIGIFRRLNAMTTWTRFKIRRQYTKGETYGVVFVIIRFYLVNWDLPDVYTNVPNLDIYIRLVNDT